jgi:carbamoyl-phosphate synthase large subunit
MKLGLRAPRGIAHDLAEARRLAAEIGFPIMVRPSYVLGGRAMERIADATALDAYVRSLVVASGRAASAAEAREGVVGMPLLIDEFLIDAIELDVDVVCDREGTAIVGGVMEHVEEAGIHSGDSACSLPPYSLGADVVDDVKRQARALAIELGVVGLMNVQFAIRDGKIYVSGEPARLRTVPFAEGDRRPAREARDRVLLVGRSASSASSSRSPRASPSRKSCCRSSSSTVSTRYWPRDARMRGHGHRI